MSYSAIALLRVIGKLISVVTLTSEGDQFHEDLSPSAKNHHYEGHTTGLGILISVTAIASLVSITVAIQPMKKENEIINRDYYQLCTKGMTA